mmetsp:Transcript_29788/g.71028  ORF Transcript_29788/g.71028 Transcript_29788/m.71028 type:complete len:259 (+) Transcript_29788:137-913(+)
MGGGQSCPTFCRSSDSVVSSSVFATTSAKDPVPVRGAIEPQSSSPSCRREDSASIVDPCSRLANSKTDSQTAISKTTTAFGVLSDSARETELGQLRFSADISTSCRTYAAPARFNAFNFSEMFANALLKFSVTVLKEPCTKLRICLTKLERFCETVNQRMPDSNPYHNALHVLDVVQLMHVQTMIEGEHCWLWSVVNLNVLFGVLQRISFPSGVPQSAKLSSSYARVRRGTSIFRYFLLLVLSQYPMSWGSVKDLCLF